MARPSKAELQRKHAKTRARQRYGVVLTNHDFDRIISCIRGEWGDGELLEKQSLRVSVWKVPYLERDFIVVYDKRRKQLATFLPPDAKPPFGAPVRECEPLEINVPNPVEPIPVVQPTPLMMTVAPSRPKLGSGGKRKGVPITPKQPKEWTRSDTPRKKPYQGPSLTMNLAPPLCPDCGEEVHVAPTPVFAPALMALGRQFVLYFLIFALAVWALQAAGVNLF